MASSKDRRLPTTRGFMRGLVVAACLICLSPAPLLAKADKTGPLVPDRPGFYCGSVPVPQGFFQLESGFSYQWLRAGTARVDSLSTPVVVRVGLFDHFEVRVASSGFVRINDRGRAAQTSEKGFGGAAAGVKWQFMEASESGSGPSMALLFSLNLPVGSDFAKPSRAEPSFVWASDWSLPESFSLSTNLGVSAPYDGELQERFADLFFAAALGRGVGPGTGLFIEVAGQRPEEGHGQAEVFLDGGVTHLVNEDLQLDVSVTRGLTRDAADWAVGAGISLRFD